MTATPWATLEPTRPCRSSAREPRPRSSGRPEPASQRRRPRDVHERAVHAGPGLQLLRLNVCWRARGYGSRRRRGPGRRPASSEASEQFLTLTNVVMANNQVTVLGSANLGGGGIQITGGNLNITNSTIGGTSAPGAYADRTSTTTANLQAGSGGGVTFTPSAPRHTGGPVS